MNDAERSEGAIGDRAVVRPNPRATHRKLSDGSGSVVLHLDTAAYHGLNDSGAAIWALLEGGIEFGRLVTVVREQMKDAPATLRDDIEEFVHGLRQRDLIILEEPAGPPSVPR